MMTVFDSPMILYKQCLLRLLDAAITAPARPHQNLAAHLRFLLGRGSHYDRVASCLNLVHTILPSLSLALTRRFYETQHLPFGSPTLKFLDYGSGGTVFLLQGDHEPKVIKIYRKSLGQPLETLVDILLRQRQKYETVSRWYNTGVEVVPPGDFLIVNGPHMGSPAVALLQPYVEGHKKDLLGDFTDDDLLALFVANPIVRQQFYIFATQTIADFFAGGDCFDLVGKANLMLIEHDEKRRLAIVDAGIFDLPTVRQKRPQAFAQMQQHVARLRRLLPKLQEMDVT